MLIFGSSAWLEDQKAWREERELQRKKEYQEKLRREELAAIVAKARLATAAQMHNGYGDFYFGCLHEDKKWRYRITDEMTEEEKLVMQGITGSHAVAVPELDGFQRSDTGKSKKRDEG